MSDLTEVEAGMLDHEIRYELHKILNRGNRTFQYARSKRMEEELTTYIHTAMNRSASTALTKYARRLLTVEQLNAISRDDLIEHYLDIAFELDWEAAKEVQDVA